MRRAQTRPITGFALLNDKNDEMLITIAAITVRLWLRVGDYLVLAGDRIKAKTIW